jgi:hypothetical protein
VSPCDIRRSARETAMACAADPYISTIFRVVPQISGSGIDISLRGTGPRTRSGTSGSGARRFSSAACAREQSQPARAWPGFFKAHAGGAHKTLTYAFALSVLCVPALAQADSAQYQPPANSAANRSAPQDENSAGRDTSSSRAAHQAETQSAKAGRRALPRWFACHVRS